MGDPPTEYLVFAYGSLREGERDHAHLAGAKRVGIATTPPLYHLVELRLYPALVAGGRLAVVGELYRVPRDVLLRIDVAKEVPRLFDRVRIELADGTAAETYTLRLDQVAGMRRLRNGDWRARFAPAARPAPLGARSWRRG